MAQNNPWSVAVECSKWQKVQFDINISIIGDMNRHASLGRIHSRNQPWGGRNSPKRSTLARIYKPFSQLTPTKIPEASLKKFICCILYKTSPKSLRQIGLKIKKQQIFCQQIIFVEFKWWSRDHRDPQLEWPLLGTILCEGVEVGTGMI